MSRLLGASGEIAPSPSMAGAAGSDSGSASLLRDARQRRVGPVGVRSRILGALNEEDPLRDRESATELHRFPASVGLADTVQNLVLEEGPPFLSIMRVVQRSRPHLLVIGTRGHTGFKRLLLGSVAERVVGEIECDILAVPPLRASDT